MFLFTLFPSAERSHRKSVSSCEDGKSRSSPKRGTVLVIEVIEDVLLMIFHLSCFRVQTILN